MRAFRFGVQLAGASDGPAWRSKARRVEALGYSTLFVPDHLDQQWGPLVALTVAAEATTTLRVGTLVLSNDYRHPVMLAKELATLDLASEGRLEVGIGAGWLRRDYDATGLRYDSPGVRIDRLAESVSILKATWSDLTVRASGEHYSVNVSHGLPRPHNRPHPPLLIGGGGRKVLSLAAREADIVGLNARLAKGRLGPDLVDSTSPEAFDERVGWVREAAGDRFDAIEIQGMTLACQVVPNRAETLELLAPLSGHTPESMGACPIVLVGSVDELCETLEERRERFGFSYWVVHEQELESFAPVVERLTGR